MPYVEYDEVEAICSDCGRTFRSEDALAAHREESHSGREERVRTAAAPSVATCPTCSREFDSSTALRIHASNAHRNR
jgi:DNA-directed RNA polymerase subunit RPC12/RpoP